MVEITISEGSCDFGVTRKMNNRLILLLHSLVVFVLCGIVVFSVLRCTKKSFYQFGSEEGNEEIYSYLQLEKNLLSNEYSVGVVNIPRKIGKYDYLSYSSASGDRIFLIHNFDEEENA